MCPDQRHEDGTGLFCFINQNMPCSPTCMAYTVVQPVGEEYREQQWARCMLLVNMHRVGKHMVILANLVDTATRAVKGSLADSARKNQPPPPTVK